jgi:hypothetical protein
MVALMALAALPWVADGAIRYQPIFQTRIGGIFLLAWTLPLSLLAVGVGWRLTKRMGRDAARVLCWLALVSYPLFWLLVTVVAVAGGPAA